jgi:hypothetical protein
VIDPRALVSIASIASLEITDLVDVVLTDPELWTFPDEL